MLPVTKKIPKEMLPIGRKPMIQICVEEAIQSGIEIICIVIHPGKKIIKEHFLGEPCFKFKGSAELRELRQLMKKCEMVFVYQQKPKGLADAISRARNIIGKEPFAVIIPDNIFMAKTPALFQLIQVFEEYAKDVIALIEIPVERRGYFGNYGRVELQCIKDNLFRVIQLYDKGCRDSHPDKLISEKRTFGRAIYYPHLFDYIEQMRSIISKGTELDDVPVLQRLIRERECIGCLLQGIGFDVGNVAGYRLANLYWNNSARTAYGLLS